MSKIIQYLNNNLTGEVLDNSRVRLNRARDRSVLRIIPEAVVFPRQTADIRKLAKFSYQLATKGKTIQLTARGNGHDTTGGAIGSGLVIDLSKFMNRILDIDPDQGLIHVQAGATLPTIEAVANSHKLTLPLNVHTDNSLGGAIGANHAELNYAKINRISEMIDQLEVVLSNGDVIHVGNLSKSELNRKIGQNNFEGQIYRQLDNLLDDRASLIASIDTNKPDSAGYANIALVKKPNGSINLTPLLVASQGTLGIISEAIIKLDLLPGAKQTIAAAFVNLDDALDATEEIVKHKPDFADIMHPNFLMDAMEKGKNFDFYDQAIESFGQAPTICLVIGLSRKNKRQLDRETKKIINIIKKNKGFISSSRDISPEEMLALRDVPTHFKSNGGQDVPLIRGLFVPIFRFREFCQKVADLEQQLSTSLPFFGSISSGIFNIRTTLDLKQVSDKQKAFRILGVFAKLSNQLDGVYCAHEAEGRLKAPFINTSTSPELQQLYADIKKIFDPHGILNPGVKQPVPLKEIIAQTVNDYNNGVFY